MNTQMNLLVWWRADNFLNSGQILRLSRKTLYRVVSVLSTDDMIMSEEYYHKNANKQT
jgi:hypothetical protein